MSIHNNFVSKWIRT